MSSWKLIKGLNFRQLKSLFLLFVQHPFFMISTVKATFSVIKTAQKEFPNIHGQLNKANAFRHALWNVFIAIECSRFSKNTDAILLWAKEFTDWHEEFAPNEELAKIMDLHNNLIGRELYRKFEGKDKNQWIVFMRDALLKAIKIGSVNDVANYPNQLVYLEN
tara:strand:- start:2920 stop:3408 length:489 start_codon:yes stop_codon:yes gene_type:complete